MKLPLFPNVEHLFAPAHIASGSNYGKLKSRGNEFAIEKKW